MKFKILTRFIVLFSLSWIALYIASCGQLFAGERMIPEQANVNGKYSTLLHVINAPEDKASYGTFCDFGFWFGSEYGDDTDLQSGFWVYVYPNWYVWEMLTIELEVPHQASANGAYNRLMHILEVPADAREYGSYCNWGFSEEYSYAGYDNLTPGYWVYFEPNWYVWAEEITYTGGT